MSSDSSDSEFEGRNHRNHSESEDESRNERGDEAAPKGPRTPKSSSPVSQGSVGQSQDVGYQDEDNSRGLASPQSDSQGPVTVTGRGPMSPPSPAPVDNMDDDGRSDISSGSSLLSQPDNKDDDVLNLEAGDGSPLVTNTKISSSNKNFPISNADDLSDVSDLDDSDGLEDKDPEQGQMDEEPAPETEENSQTDKPDHKSDDKAVSDMKEREAREKAEKERQEREKKNSLTMDDGEQLDFEAEDQPEIEKEDGEIDIGDKPKEKESKDEENKSADEGEVKEEEESLEDGEVTDEGDPKPEKPPVCRFYSRGACTWGINCRFLHPGVTDKGNYTMFDVGRPMVAPPNGPGLYPPEHRAPYGHPVIMPPARVVPGPYGPVAIRREEPALVESAWERGLRQAKEMMRKSTKRKETDMDFEEKKMNLSIGQDEIDKENDYYTRVTSPIDEPEGWVRLSPKMEPELRRPVRVVERYEDIIPEPVSPAYYDKYDYRRGYDRLREPEYIRREKKKYYDEEEYPVTKKARKEKMVREVIVQRVEKSRERHHADDGSRRRADEWSDPWMRSKSPSRKSGHRARKTSYSSGSSSFSSRSGSRSRSLSNSRSPVSRSRRPRTPPFSSKVRSKKPSPSKEKFRPLKAATPVGGLPEKKLTIERSMLMNPPAPTPKRTKERPLSPTAMRKVGLNPPPPPPKSSKNIMKHSNSVKSGKSRSRKSRSSSGSGSSGSSSESSRSSYSSSSSSSRGCTPPVRPGKPTKKIEPNERLAAQTLKGKAMDALKVSGQKPQIKLTLKPPEAKREKPALPLVAGKKRPAEEPPASDPKAANPPKPPPAKKTTSRREELLKQLKAVEDAIARKRSKI
ncbi:UNVERIFIED_CONTAM: hypothetical protein PYX00_008443 [Menopon gallinae]|uniref:C3H1-type domain-containing protein n=1 Tax=Menopon gallinae TaxID=328185 RepID=A0AAW2HNE3_9NEOP